MPEQPLHEVVVQEIPAGPPAGVEYSTHAYRSDVDGLRAVAVVSVIIYHMHKPWLPGGFVGVDMFFVISGFVVTGSLLHHHAQGHHYWQLFAGFYSRRIKRLAPALFVTVITTAIAISAVVPPSITDLDGYLASGQLALVGLLNNYLASIVIDYWDEGFATLEYNPFTHMWSLGVEEQFYFVFPALVVLAYGHSGAPSSCAARCPPIRLFLMACFLSVVISLLLSVSQQRLAFYLLPSRFWQLMLGAILFEWQQSSVLCDQTAPIAAWGRLVVTLLELLVMACAIWALLLTRIEQLFPMPGSLPAIGAAASFIALGSLSVQPWPCGLPSPLLNAFIGCRPFAYLGRLSYPLYLWHWPVFVFFRWTPLSLDSPGMRTGALILTFILAMRTYHGVEPTFRTWKPRRNAIVFLVLFFSVVVVEALLQALRGPFYGEIYNCFYQSSPDSTPIDDSLTRPSDSDKMVPLPASPSPPWLKTAPLLSLFAPPSVPQTPEYVHTSTIPPYPPLPTPPRWPLIAPRMPPRPFAPPFTPLRSPQPLLPSPSPPPRSTCECANSHGPGHTYHSPPDVNPLSTVPCFVPEPATGKNAAQNRYVMPSVTDEHGHKILCYFGRLGTFVPSSREAEENEGSPAELERCLVPPPTEPGVPRGKVMFLVGDSHCGVITPAVRRAVQGRMRLVAVCRSGTSFRLKGSLATPPDWWYTTLIDGLKANIQQGDVLAVMQLGSLQDVQFLEQVALLDIVRPRGASLVLLGDNPGITRPAPTCEAAHYLCRISPYATLHETRLTRDRVEEVLESFQRRFDDVYFFRQSILWTEGPVGEHLWGNVPGTKPSQRAYYDNNHLLFSTAEAYLWPYMCSAFQSWGLYD